MGASGILIIPITLLCVFRLVTMEDTDMPAQTNPHGFNITIDQAPYLASLRHYRKEMQHFGSGVFCMATIIRNRVLITSALCLHKKKRTESVVVIGSSHIKIRVPATKMLSISAWRWHRLYNFPKLEYDVAVVFTHDNIEPVAGAVAYAPVGHMAVRKGVKCLEFGWYRNRKVKNSGNLQAIWVTALSRRECIDKYMTRPGFTCTHSTSSMAAPSESGSALVCNNRLTGIVATTDYQNRVTILGALHLYAKWIRACIYLHFKATTSSPKQARIAAKPLTASTSTPIRSISVQWTVFCAIGIYVAYLLAPIFYFDYNFWFYNKIFSLNP